MDAVKFIDALRAALDKILKQYDLQIETDNLPTSVEFLVVSSEFEDVDRADRIQLLADAVEAAFGLPLKFRPMGLALTPTEKTNPPWESEGDPESFDLVNTKNGSAARSFS